MKKCAIPLFTLTGGAGVTGKMGCCEKRTIGPLTLTRQGGRHYAHIRDHHTISYENL
jgi:hypothetical protein